MDKIKLPSSPKGIILSFILILILYGAIFLFIVPIIIYDDWSFLQEVVIQKNMEGDDGDSVVRKTPGDLFVSFAASALQDILFFLITGLALLVYTIRRPEDDRLAQKLTYLFPQAKDDPVLKGYLEGAINKLGCMSDKSSFVFNIIDFDEKVNAFKVQVHFESHLRNLHNKDSYSDPKLAMSLMSDLEEVPEGSLYGQLEHVKIHNFNADAITDVSDSSHSYPINMNDKFFRHSCPFTLPPHAIALFDAKHWDWSPAGHSHFLRVSRFTRSVQFKCINSCSHEILLDAKKIQSEEVRDEVTLDCHESHELSLAEVVPGGGVELRIRLKPDSDV